MTIGEKMDQAKGKQKKNIKFQGERIPKDS